MALSACTSLPSPSNSQAETGGGAAFFAQLASARVKSSELVQWHPVGPGMSGYNEELWPHPSDPETLFMGPDMHASYGSWDGAASWHSLEDEDGTGFAMKRVIDMGFSRQNPDFGMAIDWNGWLYRTNDKGRRWTKRAELSRSWREIGIDPFDPEAFAKGWYDEQLGTRLSTIAVDPTNDRIWYIGAGNFFDVKNSHRSAENSLGNPEAYVDYGYVLKSMDGGRSWRRISEGLPDNLEIGRIIVDPRNSSQLAMITNHGLMLSENGGESWRKGGTGLPVGLPRDMAIFHGAENGLTRLYVVEQTAFSADGKSVRAAGGVFVSDDFGKNWRDITGNLPFDLSALDYPAERARYYRAIGHWFGISQQEARERFPELPQAVLPVFNRIVVSPSNPDEIYLSYNKKHDRTFGPGEVWRTLVGGKSWQVVARHGEYWHSGRDADYWRSRGNDLGANVDFAHLQHYLDEKAEVSGNRLLEIGPDGALYISVDQQTQRSTDKGKSWQQIDDDSAGDGLWIGRGNSDLPGRVMLLDTGVPGRRLLASGEHGLWQTEPVAGQLDPARVVVRQIEGQVHEDGIVSVATMAVHPHDPLTIYATSWRQEHAGWLRVTHDGGKSWSNIAQLLEVASGKPGEGDTFGKGPPGMMPSHNSLLIDPANPAIMLVAVERETFTEIYRAPRRQLVRGNYGIMRSEDGGKSWHASNAGLHEGANIRRLTRDPRNPQVLYASASDAAGGLYKSADGGLSWARLTLPDAIRSVNNMAVDPATGALYIAAGRPYQSDLAGGGAWRSMDGGLSWAKIFEAPLVTQIEPSPLDPDLLLLTVYQNLSATEPFPNPGLYLSRNAGESWTKINRGLGSHEKIIDAQPDPTDPSLIWSAGWGSGWSVARIAQ